MSAGPLQYRKAKGMGSMQPLPYHSIAATVMLATKQFFHCRLQLYSSRLHVLLLLLRFLPPPSNLHASKRRHLPVMCQIMQYFRTQPLAW